MAFVDEVNLGGHIPRGHGSLLDTQWVREELRSCHEETSGRPSWDAEVIERLTATLGRRRSVEIASPKSASTALFSEFSVISHPTPAMAALLARLWRCSRPPA